MVVACLGIGWKSDNGLLICNDFEVEKDVWSDIVNGLRGFHGQSIRFVWFQCTIILSLVLHCKDCI